MKPPKLDPDALERQIRRDLEIITKYREVLARYGGELPPIPQASQPPGRTQKRRGRRRGTHEGLGLIEAAQKSLPSDWEKYPAFLKRVQAIRPSTARAPLRNALERLVEQGVAERQGTKKTGVAYRRKAT